MATAGVTSGLDNSEPENSVCVIGMEPQPSFSGGETREGGLP